MFFNMIFEYLAGDNNSEESTSGLLMCVTLPVHFYIQQINGTYNKQNATQYSR